MKHLLLIVSIFLVLVLTDKVSQAQSDVVKLDTIRIEKLPNIGDALTETIKSARKNKVLLVTGSQFSSSATVYCNDYIFDIAWDNNEKVNYVATKDAKYVTVDNVHVGMTLKEIKTKQNVDIRKMPGWGYYFQLQSGWCAGFCIGKSCTDNELKPSDKIGFIFKR